MIRKWRNQKEIPTTKTEVGKKLIDNQVQIQREHIVNQVNLFPNQKLILGNVGYCCC